MESIGIYVNVTHIHVDKIYDNIQFLRYGFGIQFPMHMDMIMVLALFMILICVVPLLCFSVDICVTLRFANLLDF